MAATDQGIFPVGQRTFRTAQPGIRKGVSYLTNPLAFFKGIEVHTNMTSKPTKTWASLHSKDCLKKGSNVIFLDLFSHGL